MFAGYARHSTIPFLLLLLLTIALHFTSSSSSNETSGNGENGGREPRRRLKILIYSPGFGWSHMQFLGKIADTLVEAGHEVHFLRMLMSEKQLTVKETKLSHKVYEIVPEIIKSGKLDINNIGVIGNPFEGKAFPRLSFPNNPWLDFNQMIFAMCQELINDSKLIGQLEAEHFDVAFSELYDLCAFGYFHRIGVKTKLAALATPLFQVPASRFGIPTFSSYVMNMMSAHELNTFVDRAFNFFNDFYDYYSLADMSVNMQQHLFDQSFGNHFPPLKSIIRNASLVFVNSNPFFELPRPISNKVINLGGLVSLESKPLEPELDALIESSQAGAVLVSFGSITNTQKMSEHLKRAFLKAFSRFPEFQFIWKFDMSEKDEKLFAQMAPNVRAVKWMDQRSILKHPKLRAFLSHCGQNSISEAAWAGVPVLGIPLFGDQLYNAIVAKYRGIGVYLDINKLMGKSAAEMLTKALDKILNDPSYDKNAKLVAKKFALTPFPAKERLIQWVEFAAEFPPLNELNLPWDDELGLLAYYSLDVILVSLAAFGLAIWLAFTLAKLLLRKWSNRGEAKTDEKNGAKLKRN